MAACWRPPHHLTADAQVRRRLEADHRYLQVAHALRRKSSTACIPWDHNCLPKTSSVNGLLSAATPSAKRATVREDNLVSSRPGAGTSSFRGFRGCLRRTSCRSMTRGLGGRSPFAIESPEMVTVDEKLAAWTGLTRVTNGWPRAVSVKP